ncbi:MAG: SDR family oxidoreductase [Bdellovibrionaceae bacterium]|nr:SDR family oxidoreductase [Pseudobdellovibrionaceae bacterium]
MPHCRAMLKAMDLTGRTALVCGASQGIGQAAAVALSELGARVILVARSAENLEKTRSLLTPSRGGRHEVWPCDLSVEAELDGLLQKAKAAGIEIVVNNTGGPKGGPITQAAASEFETAFRQHIVSAQKILQAVLPHMKEQKFGRFVNVISTSVKAPIAGLGVSNTIRAAMANWAKTVAGEVAPFGITMNNVLPGYTQTARLEQLRKNGATARQVSESDVEKQWLSTIPAGRFGEAWELGAAIAFLASPAAGYINGINLPVDGGRTPSL